MVRRTAGILVCLFIVGAPGLVRGDSVEDIQKKLSESYAKLKSYSCKTKTVQNMDMGGGNNMHSEYAGIIEWARKGDKFLFHMELKGTTVQNFGGQENKVEMNSSMVCDGDWFYTLSTQMGQTMATKMKPDESLGGNPKKVIDDLVAKANVKVLPEDKVDGEACVVLETIPKDPSEAASVAKTIVYLRKDVGINVKMVGLDKNGKEVSSIISSDFKANPDISADRFVFKAPEGVQVMDLTSNPH